MGVECRVWRGVRCLASLGAGVGRRDARGAERHDSNYAFAMQSNTLLGYPAPGKRPVVKSPIGIAIEHLLPPPILRADLVALFDGHATYGLIQAWRYAARHPPQWALDLILDKLNRPTQSIAAIVQTTARRTMTRQEAAQRGLHAIRSRRAALHREPRS